MNNLIISKTMTITKASFDTTKGVGRFRMVASDTGPDAYDERMSLQLFNDFTSRIEQGVDVPMPFKSILQEKSGWSGGKPYISVAHYKSGVEGRNIPADVEKVYVDGELLKATGVCKDNDLGKAVFKALKDDLNGTSEFDEPIRVSIGFLDLAHSHGDYIFERTTLEKECPLCKNKAGNKVYLKGILVHLALTRRPANPRTNTEVDMSDITTQKEDAESIVGKSLADEIEVNKSALDETPDNLLVVKSDALAQDEEEPCTGKDGCTCKACKGKKKEDMPMKSEVSEVVTPLEEVTKSKFDLAVDALKVRMLEVKSLPKEDALKALQPDFDLVAKALQDEFPDPLPVPVAQIDPALGELLTSMKSMIENMSGEIRTLSTEVTILKSQGVVASTPKNEKENPTPRNLEIKRSIIPQPEVGFGKPMSIKELARRSVQAQS